MPLTLFMVLDEEFAFNLVKRGILKRKGVDCSKYRDNYLRRRIDHRMKAIGVASSYREYYRFLERNPAEYDLLLDGITINVTDFFRDRDMWNAFTNDVLPQQLQEMNRRKSKLLRIWSAGCSIGEEPYTIAIILHEKLGPTLNNFFVSIHATDIDAKALEVARAGIYDAHALRNLSRTQIVRYFDKLGSKYRLKDDVKRLVKFQQHDLISGRKFSHFDIIFCRNVMIYFRKELQKRLLLDFLAALNNGGYLILGKTESIPGEVLDKFICVNIRERIYRKK